MKGGRQRGRETLMCKRNINELLFTRAPTENLALNRGMCPDWESNPQLFSSQAGAQSTEPHQPGLNYIFLKKDKQQVNGKYWKL